MPATASEGFGRGDHTATGGLIAGQYRAGKRGHPCRAPAGGPAMEHSTSEPGSAMAACGLTPALRISVRTSAACAAVCTVTTVGEGAPHPWKPVRSPSDLRPARPRWPRLYRAIRTIPPARNRVEPRARERPRSVRDKDLIFLRTDRGFSSGVTVTTYDKCQGSRRGAWLTFPIPRS